jgi:hypothetical protein
MKAKSPAELAKVADKPQQKNACGYDKCYGACPHPEPQKYWKEHATVPSRLGGKAREISFGPLSNGLVPKNPFASLAQAGYMHANPEVLGKTALDEWDASSKGRSLPKRVRKAK